MNKRTTVLWVFIIISVISTSALITLVVFKPNFGPNPEMFPSENNFQLQNQTNRDVLIEMLNMSDEQFELFRAEKLDHLALVEPIFDSITQIRTSLFDELQLEYPDTVKVNLYVAQISSLERDLQMETVHHLLNMKAFLEPVQVDSLFAFFGRRMMPSHESHHRYSGRGNNRHCR